MKFVGPHHDIAILSVAFLLSAPFQTSTNAYPDGAGACFGGSAAVGGNHLSESVTTGSLETGGFTTTLNSSPLEPGTPTDFIIGQDHVLSLTATSASYFKGILFRLGSSDGVDTTSALSVQSGDSSLRLASDTCTLAGAGGVTQTSASDKSVSSINLRLETAASNLPLDITVVVENDDGISIYYYTGYTLNGVADSSVPSAPSYAAAPVATPPVTSPPVNNPPTGTTSAPAGSAGPVGPVAPVGPLAPVGSGAPAGSVAPAGSGAPAGSVAPAGSAAPVSTYSPAPISSSGPPITLAPAYSSYGPQPPVGTSSPPVGGGGGGGDNEPTSSYYYDNHHHHSGDEEGEHHDRDDEHDNHDHEEGEGWFGHE